MYYVAYPAKNKRELEESIERDLFSFSIFGRGLILFLPLIATHQSFLLVGKI